MSEVTDVATPTIAAATIDLHRMRERQTSCSTGKIEGVGKERVGRERRRLGRIALSTAR